MSMTDLGNKVDIDQGNLSLIETGKRRPPETFYAERMAEALGIPSSRTVFKSFLQRAEVERHSGQGAPILRKDQLSKLLPPYKDWVLLSEAGRVDDLVLQVVSEIGAPNFYDLEYPLGPSIDVRGQTKLLAGPNLVVWNRMGDKFADLILSLTRRKLLFVHYYPGSAFTPRHLQIAKHPFTYNYIRPRSLPTSLHLKPIEGMRILELSKAFDEDAPAP